MNQEVFLSDLDGNFPIATRLWDPEWITHVAVAVDDHHVADVPVQRLVHCEEVLRIRIDAGRITLD